MANNGTVNTLAFVGAFTGQAVIQAQPVGGNLIFQLPNQPPSANQLVIAQSINGNVVTLGWSNPTSGGGGGAVTSVFGRTGMVAAQSDDYSSYYLPLAGGTMTGAITGNASNCRSRKGSSMPCMCPIL